MYEACTNHTTSHTLCQYQCCDIHILFMSIFDFDFTIVICLQKSGVSTKDDSETATTDLPKQLPVHPVKTAGDSTTPVLGNPASEVVCILSLHTLLCCLAGPKELPQLLAILSPLVNWDILGVHLGIYHHELQKIEKEERGSVDNCLVAMLQRWMQGKDAVKDFGGATKESLVSALRKMNEIVLSETVAQAQL